MEQDATLSAARRKNVLLAVAAALLVITSVYYAWSWYDGYMQELRSAIELRQVQYDKLSRLAANREQYEKLHQALTGFRDTLVSQRFITGRTLPLAEARFQSMVTQMGQDARINIRATKILPKANRDNLTVLNLSINARGEIGAIRDFILAVQQSPLSMWFDQLEIKQISSREERYFYFDARLAALTSQ
jgi:hypothetical protein